MAEFLNHAVHRLMERTEQDINRKEIINAIEQRQLVYAKKTTNSRSLVYVITPKGIVKIILHKPTKKVVTVLSWKSKFKYEKEFYSPILNGTFQVEIYPDCYLETGCKTALTKIVRIHGDGAKEPISFNHPIFEIAFLEAWGLFKKEGMNDQTEVKAEVGGCSEETCSLPTQVA